MRTPEEQQNFDLLRDIEDTTAQLVERNGYRSLREAQRFFYAISWLETEVNNGGFDQYFFNSAGDYAADAVDGLRRVGAERTAGILKRAMEVFPEPGPASDRELRQQQLERLTEADHDKLEALDDEYFGRSDDLERLLATYAREHVCPYLPSADE